MVQIKKNSHPKSCINTSLKLLNHFLFVVSIVQTFQFIALPMSHKIQGNNWFQTQEIFKWLKNGKVMMREKLTQIFPDFWVASHTLQLRFQCSKKITTKLQNSIISEGDFSLGVWQILCIFRLPNQILSKPCKWITFFCYSNFRSLDKSLKVWFGSPKMSTFVR